MEIKREVFAELDRVCRPDAILATNTSSLSVTAIAAGTAGPDRVAGLHFFNPAPVMRLVEVVTTVRTAAGDRPGGDRSRPRLGKTRSGCPTGPDSSSTRCSSPTSTTRRGCWRRATPAGRTSTRRCGRARPADGPAGPARPDRPGHLAAVLDALYAESGGPLYAPAPMLRRLVGRAAGPQAGRGFYDYQQQRRSRPVRPAFITGRTSAGSRYRDPGRGRRGSGDAAPGHDRSGWLAARRCSRRHRPSWRPPGRRAR